MPLPTVFDTCVPKPEVLAGELPDAIFAADLWAVVTGSAHQDYLDPNRFFAGTYPTDNLKVLVKDIVDGSPDRKAQRRSSSSKRGSVAARRTA